MDLLQRFGSFYRASHHARVGGIVISLLVHLLYCGFIYGQHQPVDCLIRSAKHNIGKQEQPRGSNWGPAVSAYLSYVNINFPAPWCAAFTAYLLHNVSCERNYPTSGLVADWSKGQWAEYVVADRRKGPITYADIRPGDFFTIFYPKLRRDGHIGLVIEVRPTYIVTIEGNTSANGSREGFIVRQHQRSISNLSRIIRFFP